MKIGDIVAPNIKGQIVIPKKIRDQVGIKPGEPVNIQASGGGVFIYPIKQILTPKLNAYQYLAVLTKTKGSWKSDNWEEISRKRRKIETEASKKRKQAW